MVTYYREGSKGLNTITVTTSKPTKLLIKLFEKASVTPHKRQYNYSVKKSFTEHTLCYSLTLLNNKPYLGSVAWARPFYNGHVRVGTRYCCDPDWRKMLATHDEIPGKGYDNIRIDLIDHIDQQVNFCKKLGYSNFFLSREDNTRNGRRTKIICEAINRYSSYNWKFLKNKQLTCPNSQDITCWQYIIYNNQPYVNGLSS